MWEYRGPCFLSLNRKIRRHPPPPPLHVTTLQLPHTRTLLADEPEFNKSSINVSTRLSGRKSFFGRLYCLPPSLLYPISYTLASVASHTLFEFTCTQMCGLPQYPPTPTHTHQDLGSDGELYICSRRSSTKQNGALHV